MDTREEAPHVMLYRGPRERTVWNKQKGVRLTYDDRALEIAVHEAGHAVIALAVDLPVYRVEIFPDEWRGVCHQEKPVVDDTQSPRVQGSKSREGLLKVLSNLDEPHPAHFECTDPNLLVLAAGFAAQRLYHPNADVRCASADYQEMEELGLLLAFGRPEIAASLVARHKQKAAEMVEEHRDAICAVAAELYHAHLLEGEEVRELVRLNS